MIVDFNKQNGGSADLSKYWTSAQTESAIEQATEDLVTSGEVQTQIDASISGISVDLSDYWTSAQTNSAITEAVGNARYGDALTISFNTNKVSLVKTIDSGASIINLSSISLKTINNETTLGNGNISLPTSADVETQITSKNYVTSADTQTQIDASISGISVDLSDYWTSAQTESAIEQAISEIVIPDVSDYWNSAQTQEHLDEINVHIDDFERVTSIGLNDLNDRVNELSGNSGNSGVSEEDFNTLSGIVQVNEEVVAQAINDLNTRINNLSGASVDLSAYYTSAQTENAITSKNYVTSGQVQTQINNRVPDILSTQQLIHSYDGTIEFIRQVSQADYDDMVNYSMIESNTIYIITGSTI